MNTPNTQRTENMYEWIETKWSMKHQLEAFEPFAITVELMVSPFYDGQRFAVRNGKKMCLNIRQEWEHEPIPSERDAAFYDRCRFRTLKQAKTSAEIAVNDWDQP